VSAYSSAVEYEDTVARALKVPAMSTGNRLSKWIPVEEYAVDAEKAAGKLIRMIVNRR
jgi:hypothetical protein